MNNPQALRHAVIPSPLGPLHATFGECGLVGLELRRKSGKTASEPADDARHLADEMASYFAGSREPFKTKLDLGAGTPFQRRVWAELRRIPFGATVSYGELARRVGSPGAARAVGQAVGANPILIVVPCHRAICASGALGGFSSGLDVKRWLLRHEAVTRNA